jgi:two-component system, NtrC family, sensor histidine kinase HydH
VIKRFSIYKYVAPLIGLSVMLAALGVTAAWNVWHQQATSSELMAQEVRGVVAIQKLYMTMRDARFELIQFLRFEDPSYLEKIEGHIQTTSKMLVTLTALIPIGEQTDKLSAVEHGFQEFVSAFHQSKTLSSKERHAVLMRMADTQITNSILLPAQECVDLNERIVMRTNERNRLMTRQLTQGFLLLGCTGSIAGVIVGLVIARGLRRSLWNLHVSVSGAAGRLEEVVGPFTEPSSIDPMDLQSGMRELEQRITAVVERLREREREVVRNEQLAAVGRLAAGLAHELRNPLTPMKMLVQAALAKSDAAGLNGKQLHVIDQEITRMEQSIQSFLDFGRPPELEKRQSDLRSVVTSAVELIAGRCRAMCVELVWDAPLETCDISVDPVQIRQVLVNLLLNAFDATGPNGWISVTLAKDQPTPKGVDPSNPELTLGMTITVSDNGPGLAFDQIERIFEPFVTTKETGSGLGLSICQRIVRSHGGEISVANRKSGGAQFVIWLPDVEVAPVQFATLVPNLE